MKHTARKRFGQNFLRDPDTIGAILDTLDVRENEAVVEIGPGLGALTKPLLESSCNLHVVEIDRDLVAHWQEQCNRYPNLTVHQADALKFDFAQIEPTQRLHLVGNLPYNISTPLLFHFLRFYTRFSVLHVMLQKEVAERLCAPPGSKTYGRLSVMLAVHFECEYLFEIPPQAFSPAPRVTSAFLRLEPREPVGYQIDNPTVFTQLVRQAFSQRRKTLRKSLRTMLEPRDFESCGIDSSMRPEVLAVADFACLANRLAQKTEVPQ